MGATSTLVALAIEAEYRCHYCGRYVPLGFGTRDHIWPKSRGGCGFMWNLVYCCRRCNHDLGARSPKCDCVKCELAVDRHRIPQPPDDLVDHVINKAVAEWRYGPASSRPPAELP